MSDAARKSGDKLQAASVARDADQPSSRASAQYANAGSDASDRQQQVQRQLMSAYADYARGLNDALSPEQLLKHAAEAQRDYVAALQGIMSVGDLQRRAADAYRAFATALQGGGAPEDVQRKAADAYQQYINAFQEVPPPQEAQTRAVEAYRAYVRSLQQALAPEEAQNSAVAAYRTFVRSVQDTFTRLDPETVDPTTTVAIAQSLSAGAWLRGLASQAVRQRWMAAAALTASAATK